MRSPFFKKLPSCLLGAVIAAGMATSVTVRAVDGNPPGLFELDGNTISEGKPGDDWQGLYANGSNTGANSFAFTGIVQDIATADVKDRVYFQGGSKDIYDVDQWKYQGGSTPDKNDITDAYAAAYNVPADVCKNALGNPVLCSDATAVGAPVHKQGDMIIYFGLERFANDGDAFAGFWFFQGEVGQTEPNNQGTGDFTGNHVAMRLNPDWQQGDPIAEKYLPGDMFVTIAYPQGANAQPVVKVYQWDPNDVDADKNWDPDESTNPPKNLQGPLDLVIKQTNARCGDNSVPLDGIIESKLACAITNAATLTNEPAWDYTAKTGNPADIPPESFFEGGINVTRLLGSTPCFASFLAETRSSASQSAQLKDYVFGSFPVCGVEVTKSCDANLNGTGSGVDVTFSGTVENTGGSTLWAYVKDDQTGSAIAEVCVDTGAAGCQDDDQVAGLVLAADGSATFPLTSHMTVRYEGSYSVSGLPSTALSDEVTALGFQDEEDVGTPALAIVTDSAAAECSFNVSPSLTVTKNCTVAFINGNSATVTISGTVTNTGDVPLSNVALSDSDYGALTFPTTLAKGASQGYSKEVTGVPIGDLAATTSSPDANGVVTVTLNHGDTVTVSGDVLASDGTTVLDDADATQSATCSDTFTRGIDIQKDCDEVVLVPENGKLVVKTKVTVTVSNTGEENLTVTSLTDNPAVTFDKATPFALPAGGQAEVINGYYYPTSPTEIGGPLTNLSFPDTATVNATGVYSGGSSTDNDGADCPLCPIPD
ncbi:hypothetical protein KRX52_02195 [Pseudomonas sp. MAP12]|uniref:DUF11 domain-containing protein n=1 Tax=Geopseudomonas aromaticivorans TaxID=2849492 RepID=A0ABS6MS31_9GAMM|nr:hypothetical protein [Pseudomonas aromaticivorans]MBV2131604.1 hypothetical protein [Pseudomonas aromaticivorans]